MANRVITGDAAREAVMRGVKIVAEAVKSTLGPRGRNVLMVRPFGAPPATRDGVSVAKEIELEDPLEGAGARLLRQVAASADDDAGDGTTTAVVLAEAILTEGMRLVAAGVDRLELQSGVQWATEIALAALKEQAILATPEMIRHAATISLHGDAKIGALIAEAIEKVGAEGYVLMDESVTRDTCLDHRTGFQFDQGWTEPWFVTDAARMEAVLENPLILISERPILQGTEKTIQNPQNILPLLVKVAQAQRPLLIVAEKVDGDALTVLAHNIQRATLHSCVVTPPGFGPRRKEHMRDLATAVGGTILSPDLGNALTQFQIADLGSCARAIVRRDRTILVEPHGDREAIESRAAELRALRGASDDDYEKEQLSQRIGRMDEGFAVLRIGGSTAMEMREQKDRVQDAVASARAAAQDGVVPGGGVALLKATTAVESQLLDGHFSEGHRMGARLVVKAMEQPMRQIALNAGAKPDVVVEEVRANLDKNGPGEGYGYNAAIDRYEELVGAGVVDPVKVPMVALEKASSVAGLLLTTEAAVVHLPQQQNAGKQ